MAKKFMFVCFGILALAGAYAIGASNSVAQTPRDTIANAISLEGGSGTAYITTTGDVYATGTSVSLSTRTGWSNDGQPTWLYLGNVWAQPVATKPVIHRDVKSLLK
jgi:hypothetical protein